MLGSVELLDARPLRLRVGPPLGPPEQQGDRHRKQSARRVRQEGQPAREAAEAAGRREERARDDRSEDAGRGARRPVRKSEFYGASLNRRVDLHAIDATLVDFHTGVDWISARFFARASGVGDVLATNVAVDVSEMPAPARFIR